MVMAEDKKEKRQEFCLTSSDARKDMMGEQKAKPRVRQSEAWVGRRVGCSGVPSPLPLEVWLGKGPCDPSRGEGWFSFTGIQDRNSELGKLQREQPHRVTQWPCPQVFVTGRTCLSTGTEKESWGGLFL